MARSGAIGLDIGTTEVRAAELHFAGAGASRQATLVRYASCPLPPGAVRDGEVEDPSAVSAAIRQLWSTGKFGSRDVQIGVGNQRVVVRELDVPWMALPQVRAALPFQVQELLPMPVDDALMDFYPTGELDGPQGHLLHGMFVAATRDTVTANVMAVEGAGLRVQMVDLNAFALLRAMAHGELAQRTVAFVEIGARISTVIISAQGTPRFVRMLPSGGQTVTDAVASAVGCSAMEAENLKRSVGVGFAVGADLVAAAEAVNGVVRGLVEAIRNTFVYYAGNNPGAAVELVVLTGGGAHLPGLGQYLSSASRIAVTLGDPLATLRQARAGQHDSLASESSRIAVPLGLAWGVAA